MSVSGFEMSSAPLSATQFLDLGSLTIQSRRDAGTHMLALHGELDVASSCDAAAELNRVEAATDELAAIVLDLRGVTFIDSTGLQLIIEASRRAQSAAHRLSLLRPVDRVFRVFEIGGIDTLLPFEPAVTKADV
jgi:anti-anti-sigma factor